MRKFYSDYVRHMLRHYARTKNRKKRVRTEAEMLNWFCAERVLSSFSPEHREILEAVYGSRDYFSDAIYEYCVKHNLDQDDIWALVREVETRIATDRNLI